MSDVKFSEKFTKKIPIFVIALYNYAANACDITGLDILGEDLLYFGILYGSLCLINMIIDCWYAYKAYIGKYALRYPGLFLFCLISAFQAIPIFILVTNVPSLNAPLKILFGFDSFQSVVITVILAAWLSLLMHIETAWLPEAVSEYEKIILGDTDTI
jgi:hypothetical protein